LRQEKYNVKALNIAILVVHRLQIILSVVNTEDVRKIC